MDDKHLGLLMLGGRWTMNEERTERRRRLLGYADTLSDPWWR